MNNPQHRLIVSVLSLVFFISLAADVYTKDVDISSDWKMSVELPTGSGNPIFKLKQNGEKITGSYVGRLGEAPVTGTVKGNNVTLTYKSGPYVVTYTGKVSGDTMSGAVDMGELGKGTFTGKKITEADKENAAKATKVTKSQAISMLLKMIKNSKTVYATDEIMPLYDQLDPVDLDFMIGSWKGGKFDGGKPDKINWYGKRFNSPNNVDPLMARKKDGTIYSFDKWGMAQMREVKFRGKVSASLIYDNKPIMDYFRKINETTVIGVGEMKGNITFFFYLVREK